VSTADAVQTAAERFAREAGFTKKAGSWYRRQPETIALLQAQKSQWGRQYYLNVALWLLALGEAEHPKENQCHVRTRLARLLAADEAAALERLLDLDKEAVDREGELGELLRGRLLPLLDATGTLEDLRTSGRPLLEASLITGPAQQLIAGAA
jgi:hypothetical protein